MSESTNTSLIINSLKNVQNRLSEQEKGFDELRAAVLTMPQEVRKQTKEQIEEMAPILMKREVKKHNNDCPLNAALQDTTRTDIKQVLLGRYPKKGLDRIPKIFWYILGALIVGVAARYGLDISETLSSISP